MGSKRKLAGKIIDKIVKDNGDIEHFYDLFGGGGAVSFAALQNPRIKHVHYNELNGGVVALLKDVVENGVTDKYYQWIDRETFNENKTRDDWLGGLCKVVWSFGNNQKDYLFGKHIEEQKRLAHEIIVNTSKEAASKLSEILGAKITVPTGGLFGNIEARRLELRSQLANRFDLQHLENLQQLKHIERLGLQSQQTKRFDLEHPERIEHLERLQQLEQLQQLQQLRQIEQIQQIQITNMSYDDVKIEPNSIIYLDPPYKKTRQYEKKVQHDTLMKWIKSQKTKVYVSSYEFNLPVVAEFKHRSTIPATANKEVVEKLFLWNGNV
jgi:site-specific DNA-adenine methylase